MKNVLNCVKCGQRITLEDEAAFSPREQGDVGNGVQEEQGAAWCPECSQGNVVQSEMTRIVVRVMLVAGKKAFPELEGADRVAKVVDGAVDWLLETARGGPAASSNGNSRDTDRPTFIVAMQRLVREQGLDSVDGHPSLMMSPTSAERLGLMWDMVSGLRHCYARYQLDTDLATARFFPAYEVTRLASATVPRDWRKRWIEAGGRTFDGKGLDGGPRLMALKTDDIWARFSHLGVPWPPFAIGSHVGVDDVGVDECVRIGLIPEHWRPEKRLKPVTSVDLGGFEGRLRQHLEGVICSIGLQMK